MLAIDHVTKNALIVDLIFAKEVLTQKNAELERQLKGAQDEVERLTGELEGVEENPEAPEANGQKAVKGRVAKPTS